MTVKQFAELTAQWAKQFPETWLLWGVNAIRCTPDAEMISAQRLPEGMVP